MSEFPNAEWGPEFEPMQRTSPLHRDLREFADAGTVTGIMELQNAWNGRYAAMTREERVAAAKETLRHIGTVEPEMAWVLDALGPRASRPAGTSGSPGSTPTRPA